MSLLPILCTIHCHVYFKCTEATTTDVTGYAWLSVGLRRTDDARERPKTLSNFPIGLMYAIHWLSSALNSPITIAGSAEFSTYTKSNSHYPVARSPSWSWHPPPSPCLATAPVYGMSQPAHARPLYVSHRVLSDEFPFTCSTCLNGNNIRCKHFHRALLSLIVYISARLRSSTPMRLIDRLWLPNSVL